MRNMNYKGLIILAVLVSVILIGLSGCAQPKYVHAVFFTLKPDTPQSQIDRLVDDCCTMLPKVPSVRKIESGKRDVKADRKVNDKNFHVGL
ncbi:MAG: Dabb family protein, partial [Planctomycetota bacterium]